MNPGVSDETLHAFVDGELDVAEREALTARMQADPELAHRVCAVRALRDMVRLAYAEPPAAAPQRTVRVHDHLARRCALGCLVLFVGLAAGWMLRGKESPAMAALAPTVYDMAFQPVSLAREPDPNRILLHLDSGKPERMEAALDHADRLLVEAQQQGRRMQLEIVANSHGLDLLRAGNPYADRIERMRQRHANVQWVACNQTIARLNSQGEAITLLPAARLAPSAIGEIVTRLQQGWTYIRV
jgi:intracellular sulfur oxidation DsrE/DsrF family protein